MTIHNSTFQINDVVLDVPPENISINRTASIRQYSPLRTRGTAKVRSPNTAVEVTVQVKFVGVDDINNRLRPLIAQFRLTPICYVQNQYLRDVFLGEDQDLAGSMGLALNNLTISTVENLPDTWNVIFSFLWFNYKPYSREFLFKSRLFERGAQNANATPGSINEISNKGFSPFQLFYNRELGALRKVQLLTSDINIGLLEFALANEVPEATGDATASSQIDLTALRELEQEVANFVKLTSGTLLSDATDATEELDLRQYVGRLSSGVTAPTVNDVLSAVSQYAEKVKTIKPNDIRLSKILATKDKIIERAPRIFGNKQWLEFPSQNPKASGQLTGKKDNQPVTGRLYYRSRALRTDNSTLHSGSIATSITVNFGHKLAIIPMQGYQYPTIQALGPMDFEFTVQFACLDDDSNRQFASFWNVAQNNLQYARNIPQDLLNIEIINEVFQFCGVEKVLLSAKRDSTVPGQPGLYSHELVFVENKLDISSLERPTAQPVSYKEVRKLIWKAIWNSSKPTELHTYSNNVVLRLVPAASDKASDLFLERLLNKSIIERYPSTHYNINSPFLEGCLNYRVGALLTQLATQADIQELGVTSNNLFNAFESIAGITDDQVLGLEGLASIVLDYGSSNANFKDSPKIKFDFTNTRTNRDSIKAALQGSRQQREQRLKLVRDAVGELDEIKRQIDTNGGIQIADPTTLIIRTGNGTVIDIGSKIKDPTILAELKSMSIGASSYQSTGFDLEGKLQRLELELGSLTRNPRPTFFDLFNDWAKWTNELADEIIDKYLTLPMFKEAADRYAELEAIHSADLYRDMNFSSVREDILEYAGATGIEPSSIDLEPDFYFWNESIDSNTNTSLNSSDIQKIKDGTVSYYNDIFKHNTNWYQRKYLQKVDPRFKDFLDQSRDSDKEDLTSIVPDGTAVLPGLLQVRKPLMPSSDNASTTRRPNGKNFSNLENLRTTINAPVDANGNPSPIMGYELENPANTSVSIAKQPVTPEAALDMSVGQSLVDERLAISYGQWAHPLPGARISSIIGYRVHPIHKDWKFHTGTDLTYNRSGIDFTTGMPVFSVLDGEIISIAYDSGGGNVIKIRSLVTGDPVITSVIHRYMHLQGPFIKSDNTMVKVGDFVRAGDPIGLAGNTGGSTGAHLHFDVFVEGDRSTWIYPFGYRENDVRETDPSSNSSGYTILRRPSFIPVTGATNPALPHNNVTGYDTSLSAFDVSVRQLDLDQQRIAGYRMNRAYPSIYLALIEEDLDDEHIYKFDDYFSFASIVSLYTVRDREVPADYALMELTNLSGFLSNRRQEGTFNELDPTYKGQVAKDADRENPAAINTEEEFRFESLMLREGIKVEIRLGYSNDSKNNEVVFIGRIVGVQFSESDDIVQVEMQSLATELVQDVKGQAAAVKKDGWFVSDARTGSLLEELIASPECVSFGFWTRGTKTANVDRDLLTNRFTWNPKPSSDNIFAPVSDNLDPKKFLLGKSLLTKLTFGIAAGAAVGAAAGVLFGSSVLLAAASSAVGAPTTGILGASAVGNIFEFRGPFSDLSYYLYRSTIWDIFKEMEHRHPDCISSPVPFIEKTHGRTRMTMFFGNPDWLYFARDPTGIESTASQEKAVRSQELQEALSGRTSLDGNVLTALEELADMADLSQLDVASLRKAVLEKDSSAIDRQLKIINEAVKQSRLNDSIANGSIRPFRNYHLITSKQHIVANNIKVKSSNTFNAVTINYAASASKTDAEGGDDNGPRINSVEELTMKLDPLIPDEYVRESVYTYPNCQGDAMARRYAVSHLQKGCWSIYQGDLVILGNPRIKPYDIVFIYDEYTDMYGPVQVRRVTHMFDHQHGFLSIITPDLVTTVTEGIMLSEMHAMGLMAERYLGFENVVTPGTLPGEGAQMNPIKAFVADKALGIASFFGAKKLLFVTQFGHPVRIHPLIKQGQAMVAGFGPPGVRENEFIVSDIYEWVSTRYKAVGQSLEDFQNMFKNRQGAFNTRGTIFGEDDINAHARGVISQ